MGLWENEEIPWYRVVQCGPNKSELEGISCPSDLFILVRYSNSGWGNGEVAKIEQGKPLLGMRQLLLGQLHCGKNCHGSFGVGTFVIWLYAIPNITHYTPPPLSSIWPEGVYWHCLLAQTSTLDSWKEHKILFTYHDGKGICQPLDPKYEH